MEGNQQIVGESGNINGSQANEPVANASQVLPGQNNVIYVHIKQNNEICGEEDESESDWSSSDSSENDLENENNQSGTVAPDSQQKTKGKQPAIDVEDDEDLDENGNTGYFGTKNEQVHPVSQADLLKQQELENSEQAVSDEQRLQKFGCVFNGSESLVYVGDITQIMKEHLIIQSKNASVILNLDNLVLSQDKLLIGPVDDVIGNIQQPHYVIKMDKYLSNLAEKKKIAPGTQVFIIEGTNKLLDKNQINQMLRQKGCDASNRFDEEVLNENEIEYSDDEKEEQAKKQRQNSKCQSQNRAPGTANPGKEATGTLPQKPHKKPKKNNKIKVIVKTEGGQLKQMYLKKAELEQIQNQSLNNIKQVDQAQMNEMMQQIKYQNYQANSQDVRHPNKFQQKYPQKKHHNQSHPNPSNRGTGPANQFSWQTNVPAYNYQQQVPQMLNLLDPFSAAGRVNQQQGYATYQQNPQFFPYFANQSFIPNLLLPAFHQQQNSPPQFVDLLHGQPNLQPNQSNAPASENKEQQKPH